MKTCKICNNKFVDLSKNHKKLCCSDTCTKIAVTLATTKHYQNNKEYYKEYNKKYYQNNKEFYNKYRKESYQNNKESYKKSNLKHRYNITIEYYNKLLIKQDGKCAICGKSQSELTKALDVDHDHKTGKVRGLLCHSCNLLLGNSKDDPKVLLKASEYIIEQTNYQEDAF